jgi:ATP-binding cassette subfamily F protein uup
MNLLAMDNVSKSYGEKLLMENISFGIEEGEKIGLLGINGSGKSTLLKLVAGIEEPDHGQIVRNRNLRMEYLAQNPAYNPEATVLEAALQGILPTVDMDEWTLESDAKTILTRLGIESFAARMSELSGGQRKRVAMARALINPCDLLILDEPTNHLDNQAIEWLEKYLQRYKGALLMVTHDRYFLERVSKRIIELERGHLYSYPGNYSIYLERKLERQEMEAAQANKKQTLLRKELAWIRRGARARSTKQKARIDRFEKLQEEQTRSVTGNLQISSASSRLGKKTIVLEHVSHSYQNQKIINNFSCILARDERLGLVGPNGIGKSTLLQIMRGDLVPDQGSVTIGSTVKIGYFPQESTDLPNEMRVIDYIREVGEYLQAGKKLLSAAQMLETFLFTPASQWTTLQKLSGGEKRRLHLLRILMAAPNVLLLDEPGNDLDIETLTILEDYLDDFAGAVVAVSHDRYFLDRITEKILAFENEGKLGEYPGNYSDYLVYSAAKQDKSFSQNRELQPDKKKNESAPGKPKLPKFTFKEQKEYEEIDDKIAAVEDELAELNARMDEAASDYLLLEKLTTARQEVLDRQEYLLERWTYLNELAEEIEKQRNQ